MLVVFLFPLFGRGDLRSGPLHSPLYALLVLYPGEGPLAEFASIFVSGSHYPLIGTFVGIVEFTLSVVGIFRCVRPFRLGFVPVLHQLPPATTARLSLLCHKLQ